jgi:type I restriction enzyme S subunit
MIYNDSKYNHNWNIKTLNQLGVFNRGKSKHRPRNDKSLFIDGKYPFIQTGDIKAANLFIRSHTESYNDFGLKQSKLWDKNTLCITIAANIAETALLGYPMCFPDSVVGFNAYESESSELFMHYVFTYIKKSIQNSASGSIQDNINIDYLTALKFRTPEKEYQDKITAVLSALDSKIEINNRINTELEAMAKTLYDYWFVQFDFPNEDGKPYKTSGGKMVWNAELKREIPADWEVTSLYNIEKNIITGKTPPTNNDEFYNGNVPFITIGDIRGNMHVLDTQLKLSQTGADFQKNKYIPKGSLCVSCIASIGMIGFATKDSQTNQQINSIVFKKEENKIYLYFSLNDYFRFSKGAKTGNTFLNMNKGDFEAINLIQPNKEVLLSFDRFTKPFVEQILNLSTVNQTLTNLRDWLLPLLMNGQVSV